MVRSWLWLWGRDMFGLRAGTSKHVCKIFVDGHAYIQCAPIDLGCSQVVLKVNNSVFLINSIIKWIDITMIVTYFNLKLREQFYT